MYSTQYNFIFNGYSYSISNLLATYLKNSWIIQKYEGRLKSVKIGMST